MRRGGRSRDEDYQPIGNYAVIGDLRTVALVGLNGSIDFMCFPNFDSPTIFAALLDYRRGGSFCLAPQLKDARHKQLYMPHSNILVTRLLYEAGMAEVSDFMAIHQPRDGHHLVRRAKCIRGDIPFRMICDPRFDYGRVEHRVEKRKHEVLFISRGADKTTLRLRSQFPVRIENGAAVAEFTLRSGEKAGFVLESVDGRSGSRSAAPHYVSDSFKETMNFWRQWVRRSQYRGRWRETVNRSALVLKLLTMLWKERIPDSRGGRESSLPARSGTWNASPGRVTSSWRDFISKRPLGYANHVGLYSEEIGLNGDLLGNFLQAFTHLGLISAAYLLDRKLTEAGG